MPRSILTAEDRRLADAVDEAADDRFAPVARLRLLAKYRGVEPEVLRAEFPSLWPAGYAGHKKICRDRQQLQRRSA